MSALAIGSLALTPNNSGGISVGLSAGLSGGTGTGYSYAIYRGTDPNFTANSGSLLATVSSMPYVDTTPVQGTQYFYGVVGSDSSSATVNAIPNGLTGASPSVLIYASAVPNTQGLNIVFVGDSITWGAGVGNVGTMLSPTAPFFCAAKLQRLLGTRNIYGANAGQNGHTTTDWLPSTNTDYNNHIKAANGGSDASVLHAANPTNQMVFSIMLGTNDSASTGTNNGSITGGLTASEFVTNMETIINQILTVDWPTAKIFVHDSPWYSPNFHNTSAYMQDGLSRLFSYRAATQAMVEQYQGTNPGQIMLGDTFAFDYFAKNYASELQNQTASETDGTYYVHPWGSAGANGFIGTQSLGEMWAAAMANDLFNAAPSPYTFS